MPLDDMSKMPWGKHKDKLLRHVPLSYLRWVSEQDWIDKWPDLKDYIKLKQLHQDDEPNPPELKGPDEEEAPF